MSRFSGYTVEELIAAFNRDHRNPGWVSSRGDFLADLRGALLATGLDCSGFMSGQGMSLAWHIERKGNALVQNKTTLPPLEP